MWSLKTNPLRPATVAIAILIGLANAAPASAQGRAALLGVRFGVGPSWTRLVLDLDQRVTPRVLTQADSPTRLVVSLLASASADTNSGEGQGAVKSWRIDPAPGGLRITFEFGAPTSIARQFSIPPAAGGAWRYVIDLSDPSAVARPSLEGPRVQAVATPAPARRSRKIIVIDAGHGGRDPGAQSAENSEKDITLAAAQTLKARLLHAGGYRVVMTRDSDVFIPLETRVQIARKAGADLFISLHADSSGAVASTHGASVYTLSDQGETRVRSVLGRNEWFTRTGTKSGDPAVSQILLDLTQRSTKNRSAQFAALLVDRISDRTDLLPRTHRDAGYFVLLAPDVPAVLLEMGFVSNLKDEARLTDPAQRERLMDGVVGAIDTYFFGQTRLASR